MNVTAWLRQQGFEKVQSLQGGIDRWARQIDPWCRCIEQIGISELSVITLGVRPMDADSAQV